MRLICPDMAFSLSLVTLLLLLAIPTFRTPGAVAQVPVAAPAAVETTEAVLSRAVATAEEFLEAFQQGVVHVVVTAHLNLTGVQGDLVIEDKGYDFDRPTVKLNGTSSVRGACQDAPAPAQQLDPPLQSAAACHIQVKEDFMAVNSAGSGGLLWLHDLYFEVDRTTPRPESSVAMLFQARGADFWATRCVFRGDGANSRFLEMGRNRRLYLRDVTIQGFQQFVHPGVRLYQGTMATLFRVTIAGNTAVQVSNSATSPLHNGPVLGMISGDLSRSRAWMYDCVLTGNAAPGADGAGAASDNTRNSVYTNTGVPRVWITLEGLESKVVEPLEMTAEAFADGSVRLFPSEQDAPFKSVAGEEYSATGLDPIQGATLPAPGDEAFSTSTAPPEQPASGGGGGGGDGSGALIGGVAGGVATLLLLAAALAAFKVLRQRRRKPSHGKPPGATSGRADADPAPQAPLAPMLGAAQMPGPSGPLIRALAHSQSGGTDGLTAFSRSTGGTTTVVAAVPLPGDGPSGRVAVDDERLEDALDGMHARSEPLVGVYELHGVASRRRGGQGVVQFARRIQNGAEYAIKFFTNRHAFARELALYSNPTLRAMMPAVSAVQDNSDGRVQDSTGFAFPPFIVVERGESLDEWVHRVAPDFVTSMFVLCHVTKRLQLLHSAGLCHRDLKPANILWRPTANAWTLIDFGCAESIGAECAQLFSLHYAPPEVLLAASAGQRTTVADPKGDVWALGIVAFELLTGTRVFKAQADRAEVLPYMSGAQPLPWEAPGRFGVLRKLGVLRRTVLACLARNPVERPTSGEVLRAWNGMFESETATRTGLVDDLPNARVAVRSASLGQSVSREGSEHVGGEEGPASGRGVPALGQGGMRMPGAAAVLPTSRSASRSPSHAPRSTRTGSSNALYQSQSAAASTDNAA
eukprot:jgi/Ulvmu1/10797/UM069_0032.1